MLRHLLALTALTTILLLTSRPAQALDQTTSARTGGIGRTAQLTSVPGLSTENGLAHPGLRTPSVGQLGITAGGADSNATNRGTDDGFHSAGIGKSVKAGLGRNTMETVPGRSPIYIHVLAGTGLSAQVGSR